MSQVLIQRQVAPGAYQSMMVDSTAVDAWVSAGWSPGSVSSVQAIQAATPYVKPPNGIPLTDLRKPDLDVSYTAFPGTRTVVLGNSIDLSAEVPSQSSRNSSWFNYATILSGQRIDYGYNAGIVGNTTAQMLARFDTDVTPYSPRVVVIGGPENDADPTRSVTLAQFAANVTAIATKARSIGAAVVLRTALCNNATGTRRSNIASMNAWLRANASRLGALAVLDFYGLLVDPTTGGYLAAYDSGDGTHPNDAGNAILGAYANQALAPLLPAAGTYLAQTNSDGANLLTNGLFLGTISSGQIIPPSGSPTWYLDQASSASVSLRAAPRGNWFTMDFTNSANQVTFLQQIPASALVGHQVIYSVRVQSALTTGQLGSFEIGTDATPLQFARVAYNMAGAIPDGVLSTRFTVGAGASIINVAHKIPAGTTGRVALGQAAIYDLTALAAA